MPFSNGRCHPEVEINRSFEVKDTVSSNSPLIIRDFAFLAFSFRLYAHCKCVYKITLDGLLAIIKKRNPYKNQEQTSSYLQYDLKRGRYPNC